MGSGQVEPMMMRRVGLIVIREVRGPVRSVLIGGMGLGSWSCRDKGGWRRWGHDGEMVLDEE